MRKEIQKNKSGTGAFKNHFVSGALIIITILIVVSCSARIYIAKSRPLAGYRDNDDATAHMLVTLNAFKLHPASVHKYLPIFTLGNPYDLWVNDLPSASCFDQSGHLFYTSFPPLSFIVPHFVFQTLNIERTPFTLRLFSIFLHFLSTIMLGVVIALTVRNQWGSAASSRLAVIFGCTTFIFSFECLRSFTFAYWAQHLYQVILFMQIAVYILYERKNNHIWLIAFLLLTVIGGLTEWTSFIASAGFCIVAGLRYGVFKKPEELHVAFTAALGSLISLILLFFWFSSTVGLHEFLDALACRFVRRQAVSGNLIWMFCLWIIAAGPFWLLLLFSIYCKRLFIWNPLFDYTFQRKGFIQILIFQAVRVISNSVGVVSILFLIPLLEVILLSGHSAVYTFDFIKVVGAVAFFIAVINARASKHTPGLLTALVVTSVISFIAFCEVYIVREIRPNWGNNYPIQLAKSFGSLISSTSTPESVIFTNANIRGAEIYYSGRNIVDHVDSLAANEKENISDFVKKWCLRVGAKKGTVYYFRENDSNIKIDTIETIGQGTSTSANLADYFK